ncbi:flavin-nucleotide-binding protein [Rhizobium sp. P38BS-XIX]|uniref:pyridoxamine 5'-phosphate oxidase family protein n=1 Tax=Rhizobium sp. P38BS-XIX TaxID=2726740 RepID=UPI0014566AE2|nr:pyridoxamine 5'-phosphate oxidase family protein [Rhizobium sp. P38BS-XIX]NLS01281.1 flavin-nucleotide-binding protein [Rhizobium sp. P38BS-XIX]
MTTLAADEATTRLPWHEGETQLQRSIGVEARMGEVGRKAIRDHLIDQHREFYTLLPMVVLGAVDADDDVWATLRAGYPGFLHAPDPSRLRVALPREGADPAEAGMEDGAAIALLGIDLGTRRRNRLNGTLHRHAGGFDLVVQESFGNCPKYIQLRHASFIRAPQQSSALPPHTGSTLDDESRRLVEQADTLFVASYFEDGNGRRIGVSHRGGPTGFVRIGDDGWLTIPDFPGNRFFNTLGNIAINRKAGLAFVDFASGSLLQMTGYAELVQDASICKPLAGAERYWRFRPRKVVWRPDALPIRYDMVEWSPFTLNMRGGNKAEAASDRAQ